MTAGEICNRNTIIMDKTESALEAALLMKLNQVGSVIIVEKKGSDIKPIGIITDRDLAIRIIVERKNAAEHPVEEIMTHEPVTVKEDQNEFQVLEIMRDKGIRRVPVVNNDGSLVGLITADDIIDFLSDEMHMVIRTIFRKR